MSTAVDTSVVVAALLSWHEHHEAAARALNRLLADGALVIAHQVLVESYSVLTRLPSPHRLSPAAAAEALGESFEGVRVVALPSRSLLPLIRSLAREGHSGGRVYDAAIAAAAREAGADVLLTFNTRDFEAVARGMEIRVPK